jgi:hypothetical protein
MAAYKVALMMETTSFYPPVQATLRTYAYSNRGSLPPTQLNRRATTLVDLLLADRVPTLDQIHAVWKHGLGLASLVAAIVTLDRTLISAGEPSESILKWLKRLCSWGSTLGRC